MTLRTSTSSSGSSSFDNCLSAPRFIKVTCRLMKVYREGGSVERVRVASEAPILRVVLKSLT